MEGIRRREEREKGEKREEGGREGRGREGGREGEREEGGKTGRRESCLFNSLKNRMENVDDCKMVAADEL